MNFLRLLICFFIGVVPLEKTIAVEKKGFSVHGAIDVTTYYEDAEESWLSRGMGKFRVGNGDKNVILQNATALHYNLNLQSGFIVESAYHPDPNDRFGVTQAFWHYKPLTRGNLRSKFRIGAFHAPISFEHRGKLWQSIYTVSPSVLNTWVGEELRTIGLEARLSWRPSKANSHKISFLASAFGLNDSAGAMLAWRGWTAHNRQSLLGETIRFPALPVIQAGAPFHQQAPEFEPFVEVDNRIGYYAGLDWQYRNNIKIRYLYYDNRGDPLAIENGQYAWDTKFHHVGLKAKLAKNWTLVGQYMSGNTVMGLGAVDNDFSSAFLLASKKINRHRVSARLEIFEIKNRDFLPIIDPNDEKGRRATFNYSFLINDSWSSAIEVSRLKSDRDYLELFGQSEKLTEDQGLIQLRYQF